MLEWVPAARLTVEGRQATLTLPRVVFGQVGHSTVLLRNVSNVSAPVLLAVADGPLVARLSVFTVPAGEAAAVEVSFAPVASGQMVETFDEQFVITVDGGEPMTLRVVTTGVSEACALPDELDFGAVRVGERATATLVLENTTASRVTLDWSDPRGPDASEFALVGTARSAELDGPGVVSLEVSFEPSAPEEALAALDARVSDACPSQAIRLRGVGVASYLTWTPEVLECGMVPLGASVERALMFTNTGPQTVAISSIAAASADVVPESVAVTVGPRATMQLSVRCTPGALGSRDTMLSFSTDLSDQPAGAVPVRLSGGGPTIDVRPTPVHFGRVAWLDGGTVATTRRVRIANAGTPSVGRLLLESPTWLDGGPGWVVSNLSGYDADAGLPASATDVAWVDVSFVPPAVGTHSSTLRFRSNDFFTPTLDVAVFAVAEALPPCALSVDPGTLDFGVVREGETVTLPIRFRNTATAPGADCLLSALDVSGAGFSLVDGRVETTALGPGGVFERLVQFNGSTSTGTRTGQLNVEVSSPTAPNVTVPLHAFVGEACLQAAPSPMDWGDVPIGCVSSRSINLYNFCAFNVVWGGASVGADAGWMLTSQTDAGTAIAPGEVASVAMEFSPATLGAHTADLRTFFSDGSPRSRVTSLRGSGIDGLAITEHHVVPVVARADVLISQVNCACLEAEQSIQAAMHFYRNAVDAGVDLHLGVLAAGWDYIEDDPEDVRFIAPPIFGTLLPGVDGGEPVVFTRETDGGVEQLRAALEILSQTESSGYRGESFFEAARRALRVYDTTYNAGFRRNGVPLTMFAQGYEDDQSSPVRERRGYRPPPAPLSYYKEELLQAMGGDLSLLKINTLGLSGHPGMCDPDAGVDAPRDVEMAAWAGGTTVDACTTPNSQHFDSMLADVLSTRRRFPVRAVPTSGSLEVRVDGSVVTNWTWVPHGRYVELSAPPPAGADVAVSYVPACGP